MTNAELMKERRKLFDDATHLREPDRVPLLSSIFSWKFFDAGYKLSEALNDYEKMGAATMRCHEEYNFDAYLDYGVRNAIKIPAAFGPSLYEIDDETGAINYYGTGTMPAEDYPLLIENREKYFFERLVPHKFGFKEKADMLPRLKNAALEMIQFGGYSTNIQKTMEEKYGTLYWPNNFYLVPVEMMCNYIRGIKDLSLDMYRNKEYLHKAIDVFHERDFPDVVHKLDNFDTSGNYADCYTALLSHSFMNMKQFKEFYWPNLSELINEVAKRGQTIHVFVENTCKRFLPLLKEIPKGVVQLHLEDDDIFEFKKELGDTCCMVGGFPTSLLGYGTVQECIDYTKKLIDELAPGGGYIFSFDKMLSFKNDGKAENMHAVCETVLTYGKK